MSDESASTPPAEQIALTVHQNGQVRHVTVRELSVSNKIAGDALLALLIEKGLIKAEEFQAKIAHLSQRHFKPGRPPADPGKED